DLPEVPGEGTGQPLPQRRSVGRGPAPLPGRRVDPRAAGRRVAAALAVHPAPPLAARAAPGCRGPPVRAVDLRVALSGGGSAGTPARRREVPAVHPAPE